MSLLNPNRDEPQPSEGVHASTQRSKSKDDSSWKWTGLTAQTPQGRCVVSVGLGSPQPSEGGQHQPCTQSQGVIFQCQALRVQQCSSTLLYSGASAPCGASCVCRERRLSGANEGIRNLAGVPLRRHRLCDWDTNWLNGALANDR